MWRFGQARLDHEDLPRSHWPENFQDRRFGFFFLRKKSYNVKIRDNNEGLTVPGNVSVACGDYRKPILGQNDPVWRNLESNEKKSLFSRVLNCNEDDDTSRYIKRALYRWDESIISQMIQRPRKRLCFFERRSPSYTYHISSLSLLSSDIHSRFSMHPWEITIRIRHACQNARFFL